MTIATGICCHKCGGHMQVETESNGEIEKLCYDCGFLYQKLLVEQPDGSYKTIEHTSDTNGCAWIVGKKDRGMAQRGHSCKPEEIPAFIAELEAEFGPLDPEYDSVNIFDESGKNLIYVFGKKD
jgi:hypothetical protein